MPPNVQLLSLFARLNTSIPARCEINYSVEMRMFFSDRNFSTQIVEPKTYVQIFMEAVETRNLKLHNGVKSVMNDKLSAVSYFFTLFASFIR